MKKILHSTTGLLITALISLSTITSAFATAPKFQVIHTFAGGASDGAYPATNLVINQSGDLFGGSGAGGTDLTCFNGDIGCGLVYELTPKSGHWRESAVYSFDPPVNQYVNQGLQLAPDAAGNIYGTEVQGGDPSCNCGFVYQLTRVDGAWTQTILHTFVGSATGDGAYPQSGIIADASGNLYGSTEQGGATYAYGTIFELTPGSGGTWNYSVIYQFGTFPDAEAPLGPLTLDSVGNLYGTCGGGGVYGYGAVFKISPSAAGWSESVLYNFTLDSGQEQQPYGIIPGGANGDLYGETTNGGEYSVGTIYELTPAVGYWSRTVLYTFTGGVDGAYPQGGLTLGPTGALYGTNETGGSFGYGNVFELTLLNGKWKETVLHQFTNGSDGERPYFGLTMDRLGNLYSATGAGGTSGFGTVFEITP